LPVAGPEMKEMTMFWPAGCDSRSAQ